MSRKAVWRQKNLVDGQTNMEARMRRPLILVGLLLLLLASCGAGVSPAAPGPPNAVPGPQAHLGASAPGYWSPIPDGDGNLPYAGDIGPGVYPVVDRQIQGWDMILLPGDGRVWIEESRLYGGNVHFWRQIKSTMPAYNTFDEHTRGRVVDVPPGDYPVIGQVYLAGVGIPEGQLCCGHGEYWESYELRDGRTVWVLTSDIPQ